MHVRGCYLNQRPTPPRLVRRLDGRVWRLHWYDGPGVHVTQGGRSVQVPALRILVLPPLPLRLTAPRSVMHFNADLDIVGLPALPSGPILLPDEPACREAFASLRRGLLPRRELGPAGTVAAMLLVARALLLSMPDDPPVLGDPPLLRPALDAMRGAPQRAWRNTDLARACGLSTGGFIAAFGRRMGRTPQRWLMDMRLAQAAVLLRDGNLSLTAIAQQLGFADRSHLTRRFTAHHGITPCTWRDRIPRTRSVAR